MGVPELSDAKLILQKRVILITNTSIIINVLNFFSSNIQPSSVCVTHWTRTAIYIIGLSLAPDKFVPTSVY